MKHLVIVAWDADNRVAKYQDFATRVKAGRHLKKVAERYPDAFVADEPDKSNFADWLVDRATKTLSVDPRPAAHDHSERKD